MRYMQSLKQAEGTKGLRSVEYEPLLAYWSKSRLPRLILFGFHRGWAAPISFPTGLATLIFVLIFGIVTARSAVGIAASELPKVVKVAAVQISGHDKTDKPKPGHEPSASIVSYIHKAGADGAQLVVFPEYVLGRIPVPGPATARIAEAAAANNIYVIVGCWEVHPDGSFANAALLFDRSGQIAEKYYKTHAAVDSYEGDPPWSRPPSDRDRDWFIRNDPEWIMEKGHDLPVFDLDFGRVGILTCYDGWFPETFRVLSLKGAELIVWINGRRGTVEDFIVKSAMFRNHVALICANQAYGAGTMIGTWPVSILAYCGEKKQNYITAKIDFGKVRAARQSSRNFQQRRPELYGEIVNPLSPSD